MAGVQRRVELDGQIVGGDAEEQLSAVRLAAIGEQHQAKLGLREGRAACHPAESTIPVGCHVRTPISDALGKETGGALQQ
ncbi:hypothetical protein A9P90_27010 [Pseudomonas aeruginosa]|nr:hypothetical protein A9P90_27010 [Pseudomonas aeruginosa]